MKQFVMKIKRLTLISVIVLASCRPVDKEIERDLFGFSFDVLNGTQQEYKNAEISIGGIKEGKFMATESYILPTILINEFNTKIQKIAFENKWQPNLDLVRAIPSKKAYFSFRKQGGEEVLLYGFKEENQGQIVDIDITNFDVENIASKLTLLIRKDSVLAHLAPNLEK